MSNLSAGPLWDLSLPPSLPALADEDFITLLQKQFGVNNGFAGTGLDDDDKEAAPPPAANINPQNLTRIPIPRPVDSPPSDDSSPSPHETSTSMSRRQSGAFDMDGPSRQRQSEDPVGDDDPSLKRKAEEEYLDNEPNQKNQHTSGKRNSTSRRRSTGNPSVDESRLLKRKEQNRAAQRAFRERKERHVKELEDKVTALEEKNAAALQENENLREVVSRLQSENMRLRQTSFTFSVPASGSATSSSGNQSQEAGPSRSASETQRDSPINLFGSPPSTTTSTTASTHDSPESLFANENTDGQLPFLGHNLFTINNSGQQQPQQQQHTATADAMNMDLGFGPVMTHTPYTTIASNPLFMSFREPDMFDSLSGQHQGQNGNSNQQPYDFSQQLFSGWPDVTMNGPNSMQAFDLTNSLDELFGASYNNNNNAVMDFSLSVPPAGKASPSNSLSPVNHHNNNGSTPGPSASSSSSSGSSPSANGSSEVGIGLAYEKPKGKCTKEKIARAIAQDRGSVFAPRQNSSSSSLSEDSSPEPPASTANGDTRNGAMDDLCDEFPPCKGLQLPKTQKDEKNVEVMSAWRRIRQDPKFQDIDINQLCSEFASKARCDGCHVVIEPSGMQEILESVQNAKRAKQQQGLFSASEALVSAAGAGSVKVGGENTMSNLLNI